MKTILPIWALLFLPIACGKHSPQETASASKSVALSQTTHFNWLLGQWERINGEKDQTTIEYWQKESNDRYLGLGCTLQNGDTLWKENIILTHNAGEWRFDVTGAGETQPTSFLLKNIGTTDFVCENPTNGFPKVIAYKLVEDQLHAIISADSSYATFIFTKRHP